MNCNCNWNLDVNGDSLPGPLIIGTFKKRAPGNFLGPIYIKYSNRNIKNKSTGPG